MIVEVFGRKFNLWSLLFWALVIGYATLFIVQPRLGPTDDFVFLDTLQKSKPLVYFSNSFPYYDVVSMGRFTPISALEYNIFLPFTRTPSPFLYFAFHAVQFLIFSFLLIKILRKVTSNNGLIYSTAIILFLTPAFTISWFRLQLGDRNVLFFFAFFILAYQSFFKSEKIRYLVLTLFFANIALYYKEVAFMALGAFASARLIFAAKTVSIRNKALDWLLGASALLYLILYYIFIYPKISSSAVYLPRGDFLISFIKNVLNYAVFSDSILILLVLPIFCVRMFQVFIKKHEAHQLYDPLLAASVAYVLGYLLVIRVYGPYYLLPAYVLGLPPVIFFFSNKFKTRFWHGALGVTLFFTIFNTVPAGLYYLSYNKYLPINFNKTLDFLIKDIGEKHLNDRPSIFFYGVDRGPGRGTYDIFAEFMKFKGASDLSYDLKSDVRTLIPTPNIGKKEYPHFTIFEKDFVDKVDSGDYLLIAPQSTDKVDRKLLKSLEDSYDLVFETKSYFAFPNVNLKIFLKNIFLARMKNGGGTLIMNSNTSQTPDYYVFVKK